MKKPAKKPAKASKAAKKPFPKAAGKKGVFPPPSMPMMPGGY